MTGVATAGGYKVRTVAGEEVSSTYEGRHIRVLESALVHPTHSDGFVNKGDPVVAGDMVGVALMSAKANTDIIPIDTEGIWYLAVVAGGAVAVGDRLYISNAGVVGTANAATSRAFGYALQIITGADTVVIPVKVHFSCAVVPA